MALNSTATQRSLWAPACKTNAKQGVREAWTALDFCFSRWQYRINKADTGARSCRKITGGSGYSLHAFFVDGVFKFWSGVEIGMGIAVDVNWSKNPYGSRLVTDMPREMIEAILAIRTANGQQVWGWGGNYSRNKDAMHFELGCGPADIATGINWSTVRGWQVPAPPTPAGVEAHRKWPGNPSGKYGGYNAVEYGRKYDGNVEYAQRRLNQTAPIPKLVVDGKYGKATESAVSWFQGTQKMKRDGILGPLTWKVLG